MFNCRCVAAGSCLVHNKVVSGKYHEICSGDGVPDGVCLPCVYLGNNVGDDVYVCTKLGRCTLGHTREGYPRCDACLYQLPLNEDMKDFEDPLVVTNSKREPRCLRGLLAGAPSFIVGGGPSLTVPVIEALSSAGVFSLGVNNAAAYARCSAFICSDPVDKFSDALMLDPKVMKFVPTVKLKPKTKLREKQPDGAFRVTEKSIVDCPNVWGYEKRGWLAPDASFFTEPTASIGNFDEGVCRVGAVKAVLTMYAAFRVLYYLGSRKIYLVGCDFKMDEGAPYAFPQAKDPGGVGGNNERYPEINRMFTALYPWFLRFGLEVRNTSPDSGLTAFPYCDFNSAVEAVAVPKRKLTAEYLSGWYEK